MHQRQVWSDMGLPDVTMAINISAVQFRQRDLVARVRQFAEMAGVDPHQIELELTESMLMQDAREAVAVLSQLSEMGAQLAIDDFGTGYSSLSYLKQFPVDKLKLDQSFVRHMTSDHNDAVIAHATINLGHSLGLEVIAEGVETEDQYAYLLAEGCDVIQGYLFGRPVPPAEIEDLLRRQAASPTGDAFPHIPVPDLSTYKSLVGGS
jgi:EAL domain-containing protein (putative c-di-GMP-specific phosphodiesterase class I)